MDGDVDYRHKYGPPSINGYGSMTTQQFEVMRAQLKTLSPQQLRLLRGEINTKLEVDQKPVVNDEELKLISSLFS